MYFLLTFNRQSHKMVKHTQAIRRQISVCLVKVKDIYLPFVKTSIIKPLTQEHCRLNFDYMSTFFNPPY